MYEGFAYSSGEKEAIVLDLGSAYTKIGFANDISPRAIIPTQVIDNKTKTVTNIFEVKDSCLLKTLLITFLKNIYLKNLQVNSKDRRVLIVENIIGPIIFRNVLAEVLFEHFEIPSLLFAPSHLLSLMTLGISTALVIDCGFNETIVLPICENTPVLKAWQAIPVGSKSIHRSIKDMLLKFATFKNGDHDSPASELPQDIWDNQILEDIKVRCCFITKFERAEKFNNDSESNQELSYPPDIIYPIGGNILLKIPGKIRELACEMLWKLDGENKNIASLILESLLQCSIDNKRPLSENIIILGGTSQIKGFRSRLKSELNYQIETNNRYRQDLHMKTFKFHNTPAKENYAAWLGGAMFANLQILPTRSTPREKYLESAFITDWLNFNEKN